jgi:pseudaminic acid synthase
VKPFIVAEVSANHLGSFDRAVDIVKAAAAAGADAVKLQTFTPEQMVDPEKVIEAGPWAGRKALDLYREAHTPRSWHAPLFDLAKWLRLTAFSAPFHPDDVDFLEKLGCPMYKIASFELTDTDLVAYAARTGKPLILSTGMASESEVFRAAAAAFDGGCPDLTLLKCTSAYPADARDAHLRTMQDLRAHAPKVGISDHSLGIGVAVAAAALGADVIEKHLTLSRADGGPDAAFSMEPTEFAQMVTECRRAAAAVGEVRYGPTESEKPHLNLRRAAGGKRG